MLAATVSGVWRRSPVCLTSGGRNPGGTWRNTAFHTTVCPCGQREEYTAPSIGEGGEAHGFCPLWATMGCGGGS